MGQVLVGIDVSHALPLPERDLELPELADGVAAARAGTGRLILVEGPAGIGKTRLLAAACSLAEEVGLVIARAGANSRSGFRSASWGSCANRFCGNGRGSEPDRCAAPQTWLPSC